MKVSRITLTEPGSPMARQHGCVCPEQRPVLRDGGGSTYQLADGCPLHPALDAFGKDSRGRPGAFARARVMEDLRERERRIV